jgi:hypothetical protein
MPKPGAIIPSFGTPFTVPAAKGASSLVQACHGLRLRVATAGYLNVTYKQTPDVTCELWFDTGTYIEPGEFKHVWAPGGSAIVLSPADTLVCVNV